ncbi:uncharacterized protein LOC115464971 [Microcaecilia unicolor]|uniref:Uncharacterized protein LOC115464971 n=1 Tax=Microcaecilia unicolor TaxID=1415580 RepID=A0A6P7XDB5_9AMPH|nr:uncharacterized protein LOC115464971 [Microcaecilia unicolor]XP_030051225.1 uncharacterized protein LOC115464971 [Microcaecilia unicolor]XP_030051226.1 uncharacterized protein LOC115464971 [Microcaecilia unicolor]
MELPTQGATAVHPTGEDGSREEDAGSLYSRESNRQLSSPLPVKIEDSRLEEVASRLLAGFPGDEDDNKELGENIKAAVEETEEKQPEVEGLGNEEECAEEPVKDSPEHQEEVKAEDTVASSISSPGQEEKIISMLAGDVRQQHSLLKAEVCGLRSDVQSLTATVQEGLSNIGGGLRVIASELQTVNQTLSSLLPQLVVHSSNTRTTSPSTSAPPRSTLFFNPPRPTLDSGPPSVKFQTLVFPDFHGEAKHDSGVVHGGHASSGHPVIPHQSFGINMGGQVFRGRGSVRGRK